MSTAPVLTLQNYAKPFMLECDASGKGVGAELMQEGRPIAFYSKALSPTRLGLSTYEKELLAVVMAVTKWRHYLLGRQFLIKTDHQSLKFLLEQRVTTPMQQKWLSKLMGFDYEIIYKTGKTNMAADVLSRAEEEAQLITTNPGTIATMTVILCHWVRELQANWEQDQELQKIIQDLQQNSASHPSFSWQHQVLYFKSRLVVGHDEPFNPKAPCQSSWGSFWRGEDLLEIETSFLLEGNEASSVEVCGKL